MAARRAAAIGRTARERSSRLDREVDLRVQRGRAIEGPAGRRHDVYLWPLLSHVSFRGSLFFLVVEVAA
eukprot:2777933-Pyramimonas_sp.AAC.1